MANGRRKLTDCAGHFGHIKLALPVFHIGFFKHCQTLLACICKVGAKGAGAFLFDFLDMFGIDAGMDGSVERASIVCTQNQIEPTP